MTVTTTAAAAVLVDSIARGGVIISAAAPVLAAHVARGKKKAAVPEPSESSKQLDLAKLNKLWYEIPEPFRFFVSGNLGNVCFYCLERMVHMYLSKIRNPPAFVENHTDSISFFLGYILQIVTQHLLHAWLVYGLDTINTREKYLKTLFGQSGAYFVALIGSTILNTWLRRSGMPKDLAFVTTLIVFACVNYFVIGWIVHNLGEDDNALANKNSADTTNKGGKKKAQSKNRKGDKQAKATSKESKDSAAKNTKRFGRGGAQQEDSSLILNFVRSIGEPVLLNQDDTIFLSNHMRYHRQS